MKNVRNPGPIPATVAAKVDEIMAGSRARFGHGAYEMNAGAVLARYREERQGCVEFVDRTMAAALAEDRDISDTEEESLKTQKARIAKLDELIAPLAEFEEIRGVHQQSAARFTGTQPVEPAAGEQRGGTGQPAGLGYTSPRPHEYRSAGEVIVDTLRSSWEGNAEAQKRLESNGLAVDGHDGLTRAAQATTDTPGILPEPIVGEIISDVDAARPFMTSVGVKPLSGIPGKVFHRPVVTQHTTAGVQATENTDLATQKMVIGDVDFTKSTVGGYLDISRQDIDWTSPSAWNALLTDMQEQYAITTENLTADAFVTSITAETDTEVADPANPTVANFLKALYEAAALSYGGVGRLPDGIWCSLDMWATMGPLIDALKASTNGNGGGDSALDSFAGNLLRVPRIVVPSAAAGTLIVGVKSRVEVYEERIGFLQTVLPKSLGVQIAHGGVVASGTLKAAGFAKVTFVAETP